MNPYGLPLLRRSLSCLRGGTTRPQQLQNRISPGTQRGRTWRLTNIEDSHGEKTLSIVLEGVENARPHEHLIEKPIDMFQRGLLGPLKNEGLTMRR